MELVKQKCQKLLGILLSPLEHAIGGQEGQTVVQGGRDQRRIALAIEADSAGLLIQLIEGAKEGSLGSGREF